MSLYDRNYINDSVAYEEQRQSDLSSFIKQTYQLVTASLIAGAAGGFVGMNYFTEFSWGLVILEFALLFGLFFVAKRNATLALIVLFAFTFVTGLTLGPILNRYVSAGLGHVVTQAFGLTAIIFGVLSVIAMKSKYDFSSWGKFLFISLIVVVVCSLINVFLLHNPILHALIAGVSAVLFSAYILYDTQQIIRGGYDSPIMAAVSLYLDILNLFISLLQILGIFGRDE